jgi:hypothetical protein
MNRCGNGGIDCTGEEHVRGDVFYLIKDERA